MAVLVNTNLAGAIGLEECEFSAPVTIDHQTLTRSGPLPLSFLRGCGLPEHFIKQIPALFWDQPWHFHTCFISYSHADEGFARRLYETLQWRGVRCWLDDKSLLPGDDIPEGIDKGLRSSDKLLLCCSEKSLNSWWVENEISIYFEREQQAKKRDGKDVRALIPLDLDGYLRSDEWTSGYASQIRRRLAADFTGWRENEGKFEREMEKVVKALRAETAPFD